MTHTAFETPDLDLKGKIGAVVHEHDGVAPTRIIRTDSDWSVHIDWEVTGSAVPMICGTWHLHVRLESMGTGEEYSFYDHKCSLPLDGGNNYNCHFDIAAGKVEAEHDGTPYRLVVTLTYRIPAGTPGPIAAYYDAGIFQFYNPA